MGGVVALIAVAAVFVYIKTAEKDQDEDDVDAAVVHTGRNGGNKAQSSTVAGNYQNNDMSPMEFHDDDFYPSNNQPNKYDQEPLPYGHRTGQDSRGGHSSHSSIDYNDPNFDVLTPRSQIAMAQSKMSSVPSMAQSGQTNGYSHYSGFTNDSSFYDQSTYSAAPTTEASRVLAKYPGMRNGKEENDVFGSDNESDEGDSIHDMSQATNNWNSAGRSRVGTGVSSMAESMAETRFQPGDSRSTAASGRSTGFHSKNNFMESEFTEYRMSTGYESSYAGGSSTYSGYDNSRVDSNASSAYQDNKASRFTDASYY